MSSTPPNSLNEIRIDAEIGDDSAELVAIADAVVRGCSICYARIKSLRMLVEAIQQHQGATLAPPQQQREHSWMPPPEDTSNALTTLAIFGGEITGGCDFENFDIRVSLTLATRFAGDAVFTKARFAGDAVFTEAHFAGYAVFTEAHFAGFAAFEAAHFAGNAAFNRARFALNAWFKSARFAAYATFEAAHFAGDAEFTEAHFAGNAAFHMAHFAWQVWFSSAHFAKNVVFNGAHFTLRAWFDSALFTGDAEFYGAHFAGDAEFTEAHFAGSAAFHRAHFVVDVWFLRAHFARLAVFNGAHFARLAEFSEAHFAGEVWFHEARFAGNIGGDLRRCFLRTATFAETAIREQRQVDRDRARQAQRTKSSGPTNILHRIVRWLDRLLHARDLRVASGAIIIQWAGSLWRALSREFGWSTVRALGQLQILNRVSIIALIAVPVLASLTAVLQTQFPAWPALGHSLALAFFASVFVTLGLLLYQIFASDHVRKLDEDEFVDRQHRRYPEEATDRDDGLRRAIEHLEEIAERRPDRHRSLVSHHGDTIWIPPRDRIDWFDDQTALPPPPTGTQRSKPAGQTPDPTKAPWFMGVVPGAERRRITIEEGAKAEYWLKSREKVVVAWVSFALYLIGIGCLLGILVLQAHAVGKAAGWWAEEHDTAPVAAGGPGIPHTVTVRLRPRFA